MEKSVFIVLQKLHHYITSPEHKVLTNNDATLIEATLATLLAVYAPETNQPEPREPQEARRAVVAPRKRHWWDFITS